MTPVTEAELQAWVDGCLDMARQADAASYLKHHPLEAERLRAYRQQSVGLRALYGPILDESIPRNMLRPGSWGQRLWPLQRYAASVALMVSSALLGWVAHSHLGTDDAAARAAVTLAHHAAQAHNLYLPDAQHPADTAAAASPDAQQYLSAWLSRRLGVAVKPPRLDGQGYMLSGARLLPGDMGPAALIMYADAQGRRLTLYMNASRNESSPFRYAQEGDVGVVYWTDRRMGYALAGAPDKAALGALALATYGQL